MSKKQIKRLKERISALECQVEYLLLQRTPAYMGLHTTDPLTGGSEVSGTGYARQSVTVGPSSHTLLSDDGPFQVWTAARPTAPERPPLPTIYEYLEDDGDTEGSGFCWRPIEDFVCTRRHSDSRHVAGGSNRVIGRWYDGGPFVEATE